MLLFAVFCTEQTLIDDQMKFMTEVIHSDKKHLAVHCQFFKNHVPSYMQQLLN